MLEAYYGQSFQFLVSSMTEVMLSLLFKVSSFMQIILVHIQCWHLLSFLEKDCFTIKVRQDQLRQSLARALNEISHFPEPHFK